MIWRWRNCEIFQPGFRRPGVDQFGERATKCMFLGYPPSFKKEVLVFGGGENTTTFLRRDIYIF
jgi:hypothetical protein